MKKKWYIFLLCLCLIGCSATELEKRCFPQVVLVGFEEKNVVYGVGFPRGGGEESSDAISEIEIPVAEDIDFEKSRALYESRLNQEADYNHLKVLVLEEDFLEEKERYLDMLNVLANSQDFPRNTYVCTVEDVEDLLEIEDALPQDLGTYLETYLQNHEYNKGYMITVGDLIDEKENEKLIMYLPHLEVEDSYVEWEGYFQLGDSAQK